MTSSSGDIDATLPVTMDLLGSVLSCADDPNALGQRLAEKVLGLTGAACVILIECRGDRCDDGHRVVAAAPAARRAWAESDAANRVYDVAHGTKAQRRWPSGEPPELAEILRSEGLEPAAICPLRAGETRAGALLLLGLPDDAHVARVLDLVEALSSVLAIVLQSAIFHEQQEHLLAERTLESAMRLAEQHSTLRGIIDSVDALVFSVDADYRYTSFNAGHAGVMKALYGVEIALGASLLDAMTVPIDRDTAKRNLDRALAGERLVEEAYSGEEGSRQYFRVSHAPIHAEDGKIIGVAVLAQDMTARRRAEEDLRILNAELDLRVRDRTAQLEAANRELEAFAYSVSHDLRTPLRTIDGFSSVLLEDYADKLDAEGQGCLKKLRAASQRMGRLIDDIIQLSRLNRSEMRRTKVNLSRMVEHIAADLRRTDPAREVELVIEPDCVVIGDPALLTTALENILGNAWKYTSKTPFTRIEFGATETAEGRTYFVKDNGCGFDMKYVHKLFAPFERLHNESEFPGSGIGLASVHRVFQRHGGRVWIEGAVGEGATLYFTVPLRAPDEAKE